MQKLVALCACALCCAFAHANDKTQYNQVEFSTEVSERVQNDEIVASVFYEAQANSAGAVAQKLEPIAQKAQTILKQYPNIHAKTQNSSRIIYTDKGKISAFVGRTGLILTSTDSAQMNALLAKIQEVMLIENIESGISDDAKATLERNIKLRAITQFKKDASETAQAFGATGYRLLHAKIEGGGRYHDNSPMPIMPMPMAISASTYEPSNKSIAIEMGESAISVRIDGNIELIP